MIRYLRFMYACDVARVWHPPTSYGVSSLLFLGLHPDGTQHSMTLPLISDVCVILVVDCGPLAVPGNALMSGQDVAPGTTYGGNVTFTCRQGYEFGREVFSNTFTCDSRGNWKPEFHQLHCIGIK